MGNSKIENSFKWEKWKYRHGNDEFMPSSHVTCGGVKVKHHGTTQWMIKHCLFSCFGIETFRLFLLKLHKEHVSRHFSVNEALLASQQTHFLGLHCYLFMFVVKCPN